MSGGLTLADAQEQLQLWLNASKALANHKQATIGQRTITHADASEVTKMIGYWNRTCQQLSQPRRKRHRQIRFLDFNIRG